MPKFLFSTRAMLPLIACALIGFALYSQLAKKPAPIKEPLAAPVISTYAAQVAGTGITEPASEVIAIGTPLSGIVARVHVQAGDQVKQGTPLFTLDQRDARARKAQANAQLAVRQASAADAAQKYFRAANIRDKRAISTEELTTRKHAHAMAQAELQQARAALATVETELERLIVRAPIAGEILRVDIRAGEFAQAGANATPLMRMGDLSRVHVRVQLDEADISRYRSDAAAYATLRSDATKRIALSFVREEPFAVPKRNLSGDVNERVDTRVKEVIYALPSEPRIPIGVQMDVMIDAAHNEAR